MVDSERIEVVGGVDTHADFHVCAVVCAVSHRRLGVATFDVSTDGYRSVLSWLEGFGDVRQVGIEGTGTYGVGLSRFLCAAGIEVREVNRPDRSARRMSGKSDAVDAEAAARAVIAGQATGLPKGQNGAVEAIRVLRVVYSSAVKDRTGAINQFGALVSTAPETIRNELAGLTRDRRLAVVLRWRQRTTDTTLERATRRAMRELADRIDILDGQAQRLETELGELTDQERRRSATFPGSGFTRLLPYWSPSVTTTTGSRVRKRSLTCVAPHRSPPRRARPAGTASTTPAIATPTTRSGGS